MKTLQVVVHVLPREIDQFGICRDPYRRIVSNYRMIIKWPIKSGQDEKLVEGLRFDEFIDNVVSEKWKNHHWAPQHFFLPLKKIKIDNSVIRYLIVKYKKRDSK